MPSTVPRMRGGIAPSHSPGPELPDCCRTIIALSSLYQRACCRNDHFDIGFGIGDAGQDESLRLLFSRQSRPFDAVDDASADQAAHAGPAGAVAAGSGEVDACLAGGCEQGCGIRRIEAQAGWLNDGGKTEWRRHGAMIAVQACPCRSLAAAPRADGRSRSAASWNASITALRTPRQCRLPSRTCFWLISSSMPR